MFKAAALAGVRQAQQKRAEWSEDEIADAALASGLPYLTGIPGAGLLASAATAPGGHYIKGPLREFGRAALEGTGGALAGGLSATGLAALLSRGRPELVLPAGILGTALGAAIGGSHGVYASRRNQRAETGDYHWAGHNRGQEE